MSKHIITFVALLQIIDENPIEGAMEAQKRATGVREMNYETSASAFALARSLQKSKTLCSAFYQLHFWEGGNTRNAAYLLKHCHQYVLGARTGSEGKRAEDHAAATQTYFEDEAQTPEQLLEALKKVGFDGLRKPAPAQRKRNEEGPRRSSEIDTRDVLEGVDEVHDRHTMRSDVAETIKQIDDADTKERLPRVSMKQVFEHLLVTMRRCHLERFLEEANTGDKYELTIEREDDAPNGLQVWRAVQPPKPVSR